LCIYFSFFDSDYSNVLTYGSTNFFVKHLYKFIWRIIYVRNVNTHTTIHMYKSIVIQRYVRMDCCKYLFVECIIFYVLVCILIYIPVYMYVCTFRRSLFLKYVSMICARFVGKILNSSRVRQALPQNGAARCCTYVFFNYPFYL
jgi:hypothetical protein